MFSTYKPLEVYPADGVRTDFPAPDMFYDTADVRAVLVVDGDETPLTQGVDFSVVVIGRESQPPFRNTGFLRFAVPPVSGANVVPFILPALNQDQAFEGRPVTPRQHERVHDRHVQVLAMLYEFFNRGYRSPLDTPAALRFITAGRTGYVPTWDADGNLVEGPTVAQVNIVSDFIDEVVAVAAIQLSIQTLALYTDEITALAPVAASLGALGPHAGSVAALAPYTAQLAALSPRAADIAALGPVAADIQGLNTVRTPIVALYGILTEIQGVYNIRANVTTVAGLSSQITTLAPISAQIAALAAQAAHIPTVAGVAEHLPTVAARAANIQTVATNIASVNTAAANITAIQAAPGAATAAAQSASDAAAYAATLNIWRGTQAQYNAIPTKDPNRLYFITGA